MTTTRNRKANFIIPVDSVSIRSGPDTPRKIVSVGDSVTFFGSSRAVKIESIFYSESPKTYLKVNGMKPVGGNAADTYINAGGFTKSARHCWSE
jgi:hypothetical protein